MSSGTRISNQKQNITTKQIIVNIWILTLDYEDKLARLHKLGIVKHPYKLPVKNIYERANPNSIRKGNFFSCKSNRIDTEFTEKRIPTPVSKNKPDFEKLKSWFMDKSIGMFKFGHCNLGDTSSGSNKRMTIFQNQEDFTSIRPPAKRKGRFRTKLK
jgi:hypothetical protein